MTVMAFENSESEEQTNSVTWVDVLTKSANLRDGNYFTNFYCEYTGILTTEPVTVRVTLNGVERGSDYQYPEITNQFKGWSTFGVLQVTGAPPEGTPYEAKLQMRVNDVSQTVKIRRKRFMVMKE